MAGVSRAWALRELATWGVVSTALTWLRNQTIVNATFLVFACAIVLRTNSEIDLCGEFSGTAVILFIAASRKEFTRKRTEPASQIDPRTTPQAAI